jgi:hypothetical protein
VKKVIVWILGFNEPLASDWLGMRPILESLATTIGAELIGATWDSQDMPHNVRETFHRVLAGGGVDMIFCGGHSHGAWRLYECLQDLGTDERKLVKVAAFLDLCPFANPVAWMGAGWDAPANVGVTLNFFQRNQAPLAGVKMQAAEGGEVLRQWNTTGWGLKHSSMVNDPRVHAHIQLAILSAVNASLHQNFSE